MTTTSKRTAGGQGHGQEASRQLEQLYREFFTPPAGKPGESHYFEQVSLYDYSVKTTTSVSTLVPDLRRG